jgi:hypothetical protein
VVAEHGLPVHLSVESEHAEAVGATSHEVADEQHTIGGAHGQVVQEPPELGDAAVDISDDDRSRHLGDGL